MGTVNIGGLVSGIDTDTIISGLLQIQQKQLDSLTSKKTDAQTKQTAYQSIQTQLLSLRTTATALSSSSNNPFDSRVVNVSSSDAIVASASSKATVGTYQVKVSALATAHTVASQGVTNPDSAITQGTFSIRVGTQAEANITIDSSNDTLSGLADAINTSNVGITASVVQDGTTSYRLLLTSGKTGAANQISITNNLAAGDASTVRPDFDFDNPVQAAQDAIVTLGSGTGALTINSATNSVSNLITGVTLNLQAADANKSISVTVANDTEKATKAVTDFVDSYNGFLDFIDQITKYDASTDTGAILQGDYSAISIRNQLQNTIQSIIPGGNKKANRLSALGITTSDTGRLTVNSTQLQSMMNGSTSGVSTADLRNLFAINGQSSTGAISFVYASSATAATSPVQVNVTQAPERATLTAGSALPETTVIDDSNNVLRVNLDGVEATLNLQSGSYTREEFAAQVESVINNNAAFNARSVSVGVNASNQLSITSDSYGSSSRLTVYASSAANSVGFVGGESDIGVDVAGEFIVDGKVETATGSGRTLTGATGNAGTDGLQVRVSLAPSQVTSGNEGSITITRGVTSRMNAAIDQLLDGNKGVLSSLDDQYDAQIKSIQATIDRQQTLFDQQKDTLTSRFQAMETAIQQLKSTGDMLTAQLAAS